MPKTSTNVVNGATNVHHTSNSVADGINYWLHSSLRSRHRRHGHRRVVLAAMVTGFVPSRTENFDVLLLPDRKRFALLQVFCPIDEAGVQEGIRAICPEPRRSDRTRQTRRPLHKVRRPGMRR